MVILIADDDRLVRYSLKSMLLDLEDNNYIIYETKNGKAFVEQCRLHQPDIAFVDIRMPLLDGISAIEECKKYTIDTQFVVLTGHSDFTYAQKCIGLEIADYILKPIIPEQLNKLMLRLKSKLSQNRSYRNMKVHIQIIQAFQLWDEVGFTNLPDPCSDQNGIYYGFNFFIDCQNSSEVYATIYRSLLENLQYNGHRYIHEKKNFALLDSKEVNLQVVVFCEESTISSIIFDMEQICRNLSKDSVLISCFYTKGVDLAQIYHALKEIEQNSYLRFGLTNRPICNPDSFSLSEKASHFLYLTNELINTYQELNESLYKKTILEIKKLPNEILNDIACERLSQIFALYFNIECKCDNLVSLCNLLYKAKQQIYDQEPIQINDKMDYATAYIEKHYMNDINILLLAEKTDLTPNYFSKLFHQKTGVTFSNYLTETRINHAKRILITRRDVLVKDVALMVGYLSSRHFSCAFKKLTGQYPSEFREHN